MKTSDIDITLDIDRLLRGWRAIEPASPAGADDFIDRVLRACDQDDRAKQKAVLMDGSAGEARRPWLLYATALVTVALLLPLLFGSARSGSAESASLAQTSSLDLGSQPD